MNETGHPKKMRRTRNDRYLGGVAGGLARYLSINPALVRIAFVVAALAGGIGLPIYVFLLGKIPMEGLSDEPVSPVSGRRRWAMFGLASLFALVVFTEVAFLRVSTIDGPGPFDWVVNPLGLESTGRLWLFAAISLAWVAVVLVGRLRTREEGASASGQSPSAKTGATAPGPEPDSFQLPALDPGTGILDGIADSMEPGGFDLPVRNPEKGVIAGICASLGDRWSVDPNLIRLSVIFLTAAVNGVGALLYLICWTASEEPDGDQAAAGSWRSRRENRDRPKPAGRTGRATVPRWLIGIGIAVAAVGLVLLFWQAGSWSSSTLITWPLAPAAIGAALIARNTIVMAGRTRTGLNRVGAVCGYALFLGAAVVFLKVNGALTTDTETLITGATVTATLAVLLVPLTIRLLTRFGQEQSERVRSQERAEIAAHLHDSVLQTLALIQKNPDDSRRVSTLARSQERELRGWLAGESPDRAGESLAAALTATAAEVEELHQSPVEVVTVGDCPLDNRTAVIVAAAREALANAVRHSGDPGPVRLFAEIGPERTEVFIRDRGSGFDPDAVPAGRRGISDSITGRMERHGGRAAINSQPGEGTEIELRMERQ